MINMTLIDESILSNIADDYNNGLNTQQLSDKYSDFSPYIIRENLRIIGKLKRTRFSEEEINNICTDYNNGMSIEKISEKYGHPQETIKKKLKKYGLYKETRKYHTYTDKDIDIIKEYYPSGNWDMLLKLLPDKSKESIASKAYSLKIIQNNYQWNEYDVNDVLKRNGYILRSEFKGIREKHLISDLDGYLYYLSLTNFCYKDNYKPLKFSKSNIYSIENIKNYIIINNIDCKLLSETYVNNTSDLEWECHCGEKFLCPWCRFLSGKHQCNKCAEIESLNKISYSMDEIEEIISHKGYTLISETFTRLTNGFEAFDINGYHVKMTKDICTYNSIYDAEKDSVSNRSEIYRVAKGDRKSSRNEKWKFINVA